VNSLYINSKHCELLSSLGYACMSWLVAAQLNDVYKHWFSAYGFGSEPDKVSLLA